MIISVTTAGQRSFPLRDRPSPSLKRRGGSVGTLARELALMLLLALFFSIVRYVPGFQWTLDFLIVLVSVSCLFIRRGPIPAELRATRSFVWLLIGFVPLLGALMAQQVHGQPLWLGLASQRGFLLAPFALVLISQLQRGRLHFSDIERALVRLAWLNLVIASLVLLLLDPNNFSDLGNLVTDGGGIHNKFIIPMPFIVFGAFYYYSQSIITNNKISLIYSFIFLMYIFGGNTGRVLNLSLLTAFLLIGRVAPQKGRRTRLKNLVVTIVLLSFLVLIIALFMPERLSVITEKYSDAFAALTGADSVDDWSANARILQFATVLPWVEKHFMLGTGAISNQWNGGYMAMFDYLHPRDLGFLGIIFQYGLLGLVFFAVQYRLAWRAVSLFVTRSTITSMPVLVLTCIGCFTTLLLTSVITGAIAYNVEQTIFYIALTLAAVSIKPIGRQNG